MQALKGHGCSRTSLGSLSLPFKHCIQHKSGNCESRCTRHIQCGGAPKFIDEERCCNEYRQRRNDELGDVKKKGRDSALTSRRITVHIAAYQPVMQSSKQGCYYQRDKKKNNRLHDIGVERSGAVRASQRRE